MDRLSAEATLGFGASFASLATRDGLIEIDRAFLAQLQDKDAALFDRLLTARAEPAALDAKAEGELVVAVGRHVGPFVAELFGIEKECGLVADLTRELDRISTTKRLFVQRQAVKKYSDVSTFDGAALRADLEARLGATLTEQRFADAVTAWEADAAAHEADLDVALRYAAWLAEGREFELTSA